MMIQTVRTITRRGLLSLAAAFGLAPATDAAKKKKGKKKRCQRGLTRCGNKCFDLQSSAAHCSRCNNRCQGERTCESGQCACRKQVCLLSSQETNFFPEQLTANSSGDSIVATLPSEHQLLSFGPPPTTIGEFGNEPGEFDFPEDVVDVDGDLYVADNGNQRIQRLRANGEIQIIPVAGFPSGVAVDGAGTVYATYSGQAHRLDEAGNEIVSWGPGGDPDTFFDFPVDVVAGPAAIYVVDGFGNRLYSFLESPPGIITENWVVGPGSDPGELRDPVAVAIFGERVFVTDQGNQRVQALNWLNGAPEFEWQANDSFGLWDPEGIAIDASGRIYVTSFDTLLTFEIGNP